MNTYLSRGEHQGVGRGFLFPRSFVSKKPVVVEMIWSWAYHLCLGDCNRITSTESDLLAYWSYSRDPQLTEVSLHYLFMSSPTRIDARSRSHDLTWCVRLGARIWRIPPPRCVWFGPLKLSRVRTPDPLFQVSIWWNYESSRCLYLVL